MRWYPHGPGDNFDHYSAWGMHHRLAHATRMGVFDDDDRGRAQCLAGLRALLAARGRPDVRRYERASPFGPCAAVPFVHYRRRAGDPAARSVTLHVLTRQPFDPSSVLAGSRAHRWPDEGRVGGTQ